MTELLVFVRDRNVVVRLDGSECTLSRLKATILIEQIARALFEAEIAPLNGAEAVASTTGTRQP